MMWPKLSQINFWLYSSFFKLSYQSCNSLKLCLELGLGWIKCQGKLFYLSAWLQNWMKFWCWLQRTTSGRCWTIFFQNAFFVFVLWQYEPRERWVMISRGNICSRCCCCCCWTQEIIALSNLAKPFFSSNLAKNIVNFLSCFFYWTK
jgi:hypothetical protein